MLTPLSSILNKISSPKDRQLKILTCPTHEGYQTLMGEIGHEFYMMSGPGIKTWDFHTRTLPKNHYILTVPVNEIRHDLEFDIVLTQERFGQLQRGLQIGKALQIPVVHVEHVEPQPQWTEKHLKKLQALRADRHVFITEHNKQSWKGLEDDYVIRHGIDTDLFQGWTGAGGRGLSVVNHIAGRDMFCGFNIWKQIVGEVDVKLVGENPGLSESVSDINELINEYASARFFLNTSTLSPVPLSVLEAMAVGCPIVTTANQELPRIIQNGINGIISNDPKELIAGCKKLIEDPAYAAELGANARQTIMDNFSIDRFVTSWRNVFESVL